MISVIIPLYNKENSIEGTIQSVLKQKGDFEIVVIDDGSSDRSCEEVKAIQDKRIKLVTQPNGGPSRARNTGIDNAKGEWLLFLDADDKLLPGALQSFIDLSKRYPQIRCFAFDFIISRKEGENKFYNKKGVRFFNNPIKGWCKRLLFPRTGAAFFRKDVLDKFRFNNQLRRYEDAEWLFRIMGENVFVRCGKPIMVYCTEYAEASRRRKDIGEDFMGHLQFQGKKIWEQVALFLLLKEAYQTYPSEASVLYKNLGIAKARLLIIRALSYYCTLIIRKNSLLNRLHSK